MNKRDYIAMLYKENMGESANQKELYEEVIVCAEEALKQALPSLDIDNNITLRDLFKVLEDTARSKRIHCMSSKTAIELIAKKLGVNYESKPAPTVRNTAVSLEDFI